MVGGWAMWMQWGKDEARNAGLRQTLKHHGSLAKELILSILSPD